MIERGQVEEGLLLVRQALIGNDDPRLKALNACYIALGEAKRGNLSEARQYLDRARQLDPECKLLNKADEQVEAGSAASGSSGAQTT
jgi:hypothetical protein